LVSLLDTSGAKAPNSEALNGTTEVVPFPIFTNYSTARTEVVPFPIFTTHPTARMEVVP
jgi:hypothetical protein